MLIQSKCDRALGTPAQLPCTLTLSPPASIQQAIHNASAGAILCLEKGIWEEHITIYKSLQLRGVGKEQTRIRGHFKFGLPVIRIESDDEIEVTLEGLTIAEAQARSTGNPLDSPCGMGPPICAHGILIRGKVKAVIKDSIISRNGYDGLHVMGAAKVLILNSKVSHNGHAVPFKVGELEAGLVVSDSATVSLLSSQISDNETSGLLVQGSGLARLVNSQISSNGASGLFVRGSATVEVQKSTINGNGINPICKEIGFVICNGILVAGQTQVTITDSTITDNADWGVGAALMKCSYIFNDFTGKVVFKGENTINGNNMAGKRQGEVCLP